VTKEAVLPAIKAAVDKHNAPYDPTLLKSRVVKDDQDDMPFFVGGSDQVRAHLRDGLL
jgi:hypothetical protein